MLLTKPQRCLTLFACVLALPSCRSVDPDTHATTTAIPYGCPYVSETMTVDGLLDEPAWQQAEVIERFYPFTNATDPAQSPTRVRLLWDEAFLYVGFECTDDDIWSYSDEDDDQLWNGDVVEFFIRPETADKSFYEFVAAPSGALFDALHASHGAGGYRRFAPWSSDSRIAASLDGTHDDWADKDNGYVVEMAIPLHAIGAATVESRAAGWTFGVFRYNYSKSFDEPQLLMSIPEAPRWGFHYYPAYRPLVFIKDGQKP